MKLKAPFPYLGGKSSVADIVWDALGQPAHDSIDVAHHVREWAIKRGESPDYRIVIAGYDEHTELLEHGWTCHRYSANGGYGNHGGASQGKINRHRECLYFSPHCIAGDHPIFRSEQ